MHIKLTQFSYKRNPLNFKADWNTNAFYPEITNIKPQQNTLKPLKPQEKSELKMCSTTNIVMFCVKCSSICECVI